MFFAKKDAIACFHVSIIMKEIAQEKCWISSCLFLPWQNSSKPGLLVWLNENVHIILYVQIQMGRCRLIFACNMVCCLFDAYCDGRLQFLFPSI